MSLARRLLRWYFGDPGRRLVGWAVWAAMTVTAGGYVWAYAPDMPVNDEWVFVPQLFADADTRWNWVFERHAEHRYPLARLIYLGLFHATGHDFRAGMWVTVGLLAASAGVFLHTARRLRGTTEYADCWFPVLLLHRGHFENLLMGYQIAFTLTVFAVAAFAWVTTRRWSANRVGLVGAGLLTVVALGGGIGLLFAPFVGGWLTWRLTLGRGDRLGVGGGVGLLAVAVVAGYTVWGVTDALGSPQPKPPRSFAMVWTAVQTTGTTFGPALTTHHSPAGLGLLAAGAVGVPWMARRAWREPHRRGMLLGQLAVVGGVAACVAAVAVGRDNVVSSRYACVVALAPCAVGLALAGRLPRGIGWRVVWTLLVLAGGGLVVRQNWVEASYYGRSYRGAAERVRADAAAGLPVDLIAETHRYFCVYPFADYWLTLWRNDAGPVRGAAPPDPTLKHVPIPAPTPEPTDDPFMTRYRLLADGDHRAEVVRVGFVADRDRAWQPLRVRWIAVDPDGRERERVTTVQPWVLVGPGVVNVRLGGRVKAAWVEVGKSEPLTLTGAELLVRDP